MSESKSIISIGGSGGTCSTLLAIFITLKLCGVIAWSWWWVMAPLWGPVALLAGILALCLAVMLVVWVVCKAVEFVTEKVSQ